MKVLLSASVLAVSSASALLAQSVTVQGELVAAELRDRANLPPVTPTALAKTLEAGLPAGLTAPADCSDPWAARFEVGGAKALVLLGKSKPDAEQPDVLYVDANANGAFEAGERHEITVSASEQRGRRIARAEAAGLEFAVGGAKLAAEVAVTRVDDQPPSVRISFPTFLRGEVEIDGDKRIVAVLDDNHNGSFADPTDLWTLAAPGSRPASGFALSALGEQRFEGGKLHALAVDGTKLTLTSTAAAGPRPEDLASHRRRAEHDWFERFAPERAGFIEARGLDTSRPTAATPVAWNYVTFDRGLEMAKAAGKPLFVDVMAFWCVWCYRLDYYTYPDKEVAELLDESFVPVKIIQEQDAAGDYERVRGLLEARGIPAMGIFAADGKLLHKISGWKKPSEFVAELRAALAAAAK